MLFPDLDTVPIGEITAPRMLTLLRKIEAQAWADYLDGLQRGSNVIAHRRQSQGGNRRTRGGPFNGRREQR